MPQYRFIYVADNAGFPYGAWPEERLGKHVLQLFARLLEQYQPALCIIACNTAFTVAGAALREEFPEMVFVGTVPAIKPAAERSYSGLISVLATPGTVQRDYTRSLINTFASGCRVQLVGSARLAGMAEDWVRGKNVDLPGLKQEIAPCFVQQGDKRTDIVVLGCTHYPFLVNLFRSQAPWPVDWLDPAEAIARRARSLLPEQQDFTNNPYADTVVLTTQSADQVTMRLFAGFGLSTHASHKRHVQVKPGIKAGGAYHH